MTYKMHLYYYVKCTYEQYCIQWDLHVNTSNTKSVVFAKGKAKSFKFYICNAEIKFVMIFNTLVLHFLGVDEFLKLKNILPNRLLKLCFLCCNDKNTCDGQLIYK